MKTYKRNPYQLLQMDKETLLYVNTPVRMRMGCSNADLDAILEDVTTVAFLRRDNEFFASITKQWYKAYVDGGRFSEKQAYYLAKAISEITEEEKKDITLEEFNTWLNSQN